MVSVLELGCKQMEISYKKGRISSNVRRFRVKLKLGYNIWVFFNQNRKLILSSMLEIIVRIRIYNFLFSVSFWLIY